MTLPPHSSEPTLTYPKFPRTVPRSRASQLKIQKRHQHQKKKEKKSQANETGLAHSGKSLLTKAIQAGFTQPNPGPRIVPRRRTPFVLQKKQQHQTRKEKKSRVLHLRVSRTSQLKLKKQKMRV
jgi:hypothetical protein